MLEQKTRYLQIAFNHDIASASRVLSSIPDNPRILLEAGTPFIKHEGIAGIRYLRAHWSGDIVADLKTMDGAVGEVMLAREAGATAATVMGSATVETLNNFIHTCKQVGMISMIDMLGVVDPLKSILRLRSPPDVVILHKGRDEEGTKGKVIQYKHISKIKSKYNVLISAAGGVDLREARSAIFNGANIVVVNMVDSGDYWKGISSEEDISTIAEQFLQTIQ